MHVLLVVLVAALVVSAQGADTWINRVVSFQDGSVRVDIVTNAAVASAGTLEFDSAPHTPVDLALEDCVRTSVGSGYFLYACHLTNVDSNDNSVGANPAADNAIVITQASVEKASVVQAVWEHLQPGTAIALKTGTGCKAADFATINDPVDVTDIDILLIGLNTGQNIDCDSSGSDVSTTGLIVAVSILSAVGAGVLVYGIIIYVRRRRGGQYSLVPRE